MADALACANEVVGLAEDVVVGGDVLSQVQSANKACVGSQHVVVDACERQLLSDVVTVGVDAAYEVEVANERVVVLDEAALDGG